MSYEDYAAQQAKVRAEEKFKRMDETARKLGYCCTYYSKVNEQYGPNKTRKAPPTSCRCGRCDGSGRRLAKYANEPEPIPPEISAGVSLTPEYEDFKPGFEAPEGRKACPSCGGWGHVAPEAPSLADTLGGYSRRRR